MVSLSGKFRFKGIVVTMSSGIKTGKTLSVTGNTIKADADK